ncbi:hypothetical protein ACSNOD_09245, partial [Streptomyces sp. URMC 123]
GARLRRGRVASRVPSRSPLAVAGALFAPVVLLGVAGMGLGVALLVRRALGGAAAVAAVALLPLLCAAAGYGTAGRPYPWAWPVHPWDSTAGIALALAVFAPGAASLLFRDRRAADRPVPCWHG